MVGGNTQFKEGHEFAVEFQLQYELELECEFEQQLWRLLKRRIP